MPLYSNRFREGITLAGDITLAGWLQPKLCANRVIDNYDP